MWLGPPYMYRKMTLLALAGKCGFLGASGLTNFVCPSAATAWRAKKSSPSMADRATEAKPPPVCQRNSRRVRPQKLRGISSSSFSDASQKRATLLRSVANLLIDVHELVQIQRQQAKAPQR